MSDLPEEITYLVKCPACGHDTFAEIVTGITSTDPFKNVKFYTDLDMAEPDYMGLETEGGTIKHIECNACHHVVAEDHAAFREWVKRNGIVKS